MEATYYTIREVAETLRISVSTVRRAIRDGRLQAVRIGAQRQLRVSESSIDDFIAGASESEERPAASDAPRADRAGHPTGARLAAPPPIKQTVGLTEGRLPNGVPWTLINADISEGLRLLPDQSVDCAVTSPPYFWQRDYGVDGQIGHESSIDAFVEVLTSSFTELRRVLKDDGTFFLNLGDTYYSAKGRPHGRDKKHSGRQLARTQLRAVDGPGLGLPRKSLIGIPWRVALALQADGWTLRSDVIWQRPATLPEPSAHDRPWRTYEHLFIFSKGTKYWFNRDGLDGDEDVWRITARAENPGVHFAPFPRELVSRCLSVGCRPGGTVLDPFVGSGTTMLEALRRGSPAIGIDLNPEYCGYVRQRIETELTGKGVTGP